MQTSPLEAVTPNFNLSEDQFDVRCAGYGGAGLARIHYEMPRQVTHFRPHLVVLQIGSNDIGKDFQVDDVEILSSSIIKLAKRIHSSFNVPNVVISQLFFRNRARCPQFNEFTQMVNDSLHARLPGDIMGITFWRHIGFWRPEVRERIQNKDEVHFNDEGNLKYYKSLKGALLHFGKK